MTMTELAPTTFEIPTLETERMFLRAPRADDIPDEIAFYASDRAIHLGGRLDAGQVWRLFAGLVGHWALRGFGFWACEDKATGRYLGRVGGWYPGDWPEPEIGWTMMGHAEGKGYAHEAALAARAWSYEALGWTTAVSYIAPDNVRSQALARRLGATLEGEWTTMAGHRAQIWRHPGPHEGPHEGETA